MPSGVSAMLQKFAEHYHDVWCAQMIADGWHYGEYYDEDDRLHPSLLEFTNLRTKVMGLKIILRLDAFHHSRTISLRL